MKNEDVVLIHRFLADDEAAFEELVKKYQKAVHTLAWRKIGDFHIAEDITQDAFLKVYQKLRTPKDPNQFAGWLYVITTRLCATWLRKKRIQTDPLEDAETTMTLKDVYSEHVAEDRTKTAADTQREVVKKLLAKLKESERTVMTLHYLGEMKIEEISRFLGVSSSTIKSRLRRARNRLQKEETMIREALDHFQVSPNLTQDILQKVNRLKPEAPPGGNPLVPWTVAASSVVLIMLILGIGSQYLAHFQKPYSLDAQAEMAIELVEAPVVVNLDTEPDLRRDIRSVNTLGNNENNGQKPDAVLLASAQSEGDDVSAPAPQWVQTAPIKGSEIDNLLVTPEGELYVLGSNQDIYKLSENGKTWQHIFDTNLLNIRSWAGRQPIAKWNNTLYYVPSDQLFAITDGGKTWDLLYSWDVSKHGTPIELILTEHAFYIAFMKGIYRSDDHGKTWKPISEGVRKPISEGLNGYIRSFVNIQNTLFAGTDNGLYRLMEDDTWERVKFSVPVKWIRSIATTENNIYVAAELDSSAVTSEKERTWWVFRSSDLGRQWRHITPSDVWSGREKQPFIKLVAVGETLLIISPDMGMVRSTDSGDTWMPVQIPDTYPPTHSNSPAVALTERIFYVSNYDNGLHRSTDGGQSWQAVNINSKPPSQVDNLITIRKSDEEKDISNVLFAKVGIEIIKTADKGNFWTIIKMEKPKTLDGTTERPFITQIFKSGDVIYAKGGDSYGGDGSGDSSGDGITRLYQVSPDGRTLMRVQDMPIFDAKPLRYHLFGRSTNTFASPEAEKEFIEKLQRSTPGATQFFKQLAKWDPEQPDMYIKLGFHGPIAISNETFYMEYNFKLFRGKRGDKVWHDTGVEETDDLTLDVAMRDLKLAVSGNTVYVGKRDGTLLQSFDTGITWNEVPMDPIPVRIFNDIVFAGSTVYVATDAGVAASDDGKHWSPVTDTDGTNLIMEDLAVDCTKIYGVTKNTGVYRLESGTWERVVSEIPENVTSLAVDGDTLYVGTEDHGMLHLNLEE